MFDGLDLSKLGGMLGDVQAKAKEMQEASASKIFTAKSGGGLISVSMSGLPQLVDITIDDSLLEDKESLQILLMAAVNDCMKSVEENRKQEALGMLGGLNLFGQNK